MLLALWGIGDLMIIFLAALLDVPAELHEAAALDGANAWQRFRYVTLPTISPVLLFAAITGVIATLQYFTQAAVAASVASGQATTRRRHLRHVRLPGGLDVHLSAVALRRSASGTTRSATPTRWPSCCSWSRSR